MQTLDMMWAEVGVTNDDKVSSLGQEEKDTGW